MQIVFFFLLISVVVIQKNFFLSMNTDFNTNPLPTSLKNIYISLSYFTYPNRITFTLQKSLRNI